MAQPTVCACYIEAGEPEILQRSLNVMAAYPWITAIVVLHTDHDGPAQYVSNGVKHLYKNYGHGFDKQPEDGGFDEVAARNDVLTAGRATGCDWLLVIDADEFFLPSTYQPIVMANRDHKDAIFFECFHFFSPTQYLRFNRVIQAPTIGSPQMHDPHMRAIRSRTTIGYLLNHNEQMRATWPNRTNHCVLTKIQPEQLVCVPGMYHIHTRHMFDPKRAKYMQGKKIAELPLRSVAAGVDVFPKSYLDAYVPMVTADTPAHQSAE